MRSVRVGRCVAMSVHTGIVVAAMSCEGVRVSGSVGGCFRWLVDGCSGRRLVGVEVEAV
jgi:hypothetical protein